MPIINDLSSWQPFLWIIWALGGPAEVTIVGPDQFRGPLQVSVAGEGHVVHQAGGPVTCQLAELILNAKSRGAVVFFIMGSSSINSF